MRKKIRVILEYILAVVVIVFLALAIAGVVVVKFHGDDLQEYVIDQVNKQVDTRIDVGEINVRVFHKFPNTSIVISNVVIWSSHNVDLSEFPEYPADTLLSAESVTLSFNLLKMIRKKFDIRQVEVNRGYLQILIDSHGEGNYRMLKEKRGKGGDRQSIDIGQLRLLNLELKLNNRAKEIQADAHMEDLGLNGKFSRNQTQIRGNLNGSIQQISNKGILYASERSLSARMNMNVEDSIYTLVSGQVQIDRIRADVEGNFMPRMDRGVELDLIAAARAMEIHEILDLLPSDLVKPLKQVRGNGKLEIYTHISGLASSTLTPSVEADFQTTNANLFWERLPFSLKELNLKGSYSNGGKFSPLTTRLEISDIGATIGKDRLRGRGSIVNLLDPDFAFQLQGKIHPEQWLAWYEKIPLDEINGSIESDIRVSGKYRRNNPRGKRFTSLDIGGNIALENIILRISPGQKTFKNINGSVSIDNDFWKPSFSGTFGSSDFNISGTGLNLISFLTGDKENLVASARFRSHFLDLQEILDQLPRDASGDRAAFKFPDRMDMRLEFIIDDLTKDRLTASNVRGIALYESPFFFVDSLSMQAMEGTLRGSFGLVQDTRGSIYSTVDASLYALNINKLFHAFNNFGQNQLTSDHLAGTITGHSVFSANFDTTFRIIPSSILSENNIRIVNGELNRFTPIMALSRFVDVEELENIRFETLENNILIKDSQVTIPAMEIQSNALDLSASGIHKFNNQYDYRLELKLSQILYGKARQGNRSHEFEVAEDESDQRILFLEISDDGSGARVEWDREHASQKIREDLKEEKTELKILLNKELGLFKHDDEVNKRIQKQEQQNEELFRFEFDEDSTQREDNSKKGRRKRIRRDSSENKPAAKYVIDE